MKHFAAVVLAAGRARRFGADKLSQPFDGAPLVGGAIKVACAAPVERIAIVVRPGSALQDYCSSVAAQDPRVAVVESDNEALSDSLRAGLAAVPRLDGTFVFLGDMPCAPPGLAARMAQRLGAAFAVQPMVDGKPGHPVLLSPRAAALAQLIQGDRGAGEMLRQHAAEVAYMEMDEPGVTLDIDTTADYEALTRGDRT